MSVDTSSEGARVYKALWTAWKSVAAYGRSSRDATGLGVSDFAILEVCLQQGPRPVNALGREVRLTSGSITTAIDRLAARKLVRRLDSETDARVSLVALTAKGHALIGQARAQQARRLDGLAAILDRGERAQLVSLLQKISLHADGLTPEPHPSPASSPPPTEEPGLAVNLL